MLGEDDLYRGVRNEQAVDVLEEVIVDRLVESLQMLGNSVRVAPCFKSAFDATGTKQWHSNNALLLKGFERVIRARQGCKPT